MGYVVIYTNQLHGVRSRLYTEYIAGNFHGVGKFVYRKMVVFVSKNFV